MVGSVHEVHEGEGLFLYALVNNFKHFYASVQVIAKVDVGYLAAADSQESFLGPLRKPIDSGAID